MSMSLRQSMAVLFSLAEEAGGKMRTQGRFLDLGPEIWELNVSVEDGKGFLALITRGVNDPVGVDFDPPINLLVVPGGEVQVSRKQRYEIHCMGAHMTVQYQWDPTRKSFDQRWNKSGVECDPVYEWQRHESYQHLMALLHFAERDAVKMDWLAAQRWLDALPQPIGFASLRKASL